jgi:hypothetical protein
MYGPREDRDIPRVKVPSQSSGLPGLSSYPGEQMRAPPSSIREEAQNVL